MDYLNGSISMELASIKEVAVFSRMAQIALRVVLPMIATSEILKLLLIKIAYWT
jgi:hypothetical protein